jgi:hypothetical protein
MHADHAQECSHDRHGALATRTVKVCALAPADVRGVQPHRFELVARVRHPHGHGVAFRVCLARRGRSGVRGSRRGTSRQCGIAHRGGLQDREGQPDDTILNSRFPMSFDHPA